MRPHAAAPVLHIAETARGGVGTWLNQLLPELDPGCVPGPVSAGSRCDDDTPLRVHVVLPAQDRFMLSHVGDAAISTYRRDGRSPLSLLILACAAWCALRATRPHIVHLHSTFAGLVVRPLLLVARLLPGPRPHVVYSPHGWAFQIAAAPLRRRAIVAVERWLAHLTDRIVVLSDAEHAECIALGFPAAKLLRIYNGIAETAPPVPDAPADWADPRLKVLFVGRFDRQKGLDTLLAAAAGATDRMVVRCIGAGVVDGGRAAAPPANVELLGWLDEPRITAQLAQADVVAMPSRWEGFGLVALEAMRAARPVVASRVGGLPEVVEDGVTGRLVAPDDADALRATLLADPPAVRHRMGAAGRARFVARFTARRSARGVATLYRHLLRHEHRQPVAASWA